MDKAEKTNVLGVLALALFVIYAISAHQWLFWTGLVILILALFEIPPGYFIAKYWMKFAMFLGKINSAVILTLVFYLIFTPIGVLYRIFNQKAVAHFKNSDTTYSDYCEEYNKEFFERVW